jgi:tRNA pseudouridine55 synthase
MDGILLIDKPKEWTSFDVVAKIRGMVRAQTGQKKPKVGHAGTLDPLATGLLIVLVGKDATKRQAEFMKQDKVYEVELTLGQISTTDDDEGEKTAVSDKQPTLDQVQQAVTSFVGEIQQVPPIFSAIKVDGKRAYKQARAGKEVKMEPRIVTIYSITDLEYVYPFVRFVTKVSSGTYIRSLARDIGQNLG